MEAAVAGAEGHSSKAQHLGLGRLAAARFDAAVRCWVSEAVSREAQAIAVLGGADVVANRNLVDDGVNANHVYGAGGSLPLRAPCPHPCPAHVERSPRRRTRGHRG